MDDGVGVRLIAGNANRPLAEAVANRIASALGTTTPLASSRIECFSDREVFVEIHENIRGADVFALQPTSSPANDNLMELLIIIDALRRASARRITAVMPYFGYARQDRKTAARTPISAKLVANLVSRAGADRLLTMDLHSGQIQGFFDIPTDNLSAAPVFALDIREHFGDLSRLTIVSPDVGGVLRARDLASRLGAELAIVDKRRPRPGQAVTRNVIGSVEGRDCVLVDDICDTAGTLCEAGELLRQRGAHSAYAYVSHGVLSGPAIERIASSALDALVTTDSIAMTPQGKAETRIRTVTIAPMFAQAILNVAGDTSVSSLFSERTLAPMYGEAIAPLANQRN